MVRLTFRHGRPVAPGDRYVLRETGRGEIVGGGAISDVAPPKASRGRGTQLASVPLHDERQELTRAIARARPIGLDVALLDEHQRSVLGPLEQDGVIKVVAGYALSPSWEGELAHHPYVQLLERNLFAPPAVPDTVTPQELRALRRRQLVVAKDGIYFASRVRSAATAILAQLARDRPQGFTVSEARQALRTSRRWAIPLLELLDESGVTIRHGDHRQLRPKLHRGGV